MKTKKALSQEKRQRISDKVLILTLCVQLLLLVNQSIGLYTTAAQSMQASIIEPTGEKIQIHIETDTGRQTIVQKILKNTRNWLSSYFVGGIEKTNAQTGITISIDGSNIGATANVDYYIEARESTGQGTPYRFLEGNSTSVTVNGADLGLTNQTTIENHLEAMGLSTSSSYTIDYYVYVRATAIGAVSGETLTSEITYQKFDSVTYQYGSEVTNTVQVSHSWEDGYIYGPTGYDKTGNALNIGDYSSDYPDWWVWINFAPEIPQGVEITEAHIEVYERYSDGVYPTVTILAVDEDSASYPISHSDYDSKTTTSENVSWSISSWSSDTWIESPDISNVIQELVNRTGWTSSSVCGILIQDSPGWGGSMNRVGCESYDHSPSLAPKLEVTYFSYTSSWYPLPPLSLTELPITIDLAALTTLILVTSYAVKNRRKRY